MASPQIEDGYTKLANEILEKLGKLYLRPNQWQILMCIFRRVYGFHKKEDYITNSQLVSDTSLSKEVVSRSITDMVARNILTRDNKIIGFQKDWEKWQLPEQSTPKKLTNPSTRLTKQSTKVDGPPVTQKIKDTIQKKYSPFPEFPGVLLSKEELEKLIKEFGEEETKRRCESLFLYMGSHGKKYKSHYMTILSWDRMEKKRQAPVVKRESYSPYELMGGSNEE